MPSQSNRSAAFTLTELLVVLAIIGVLLSLTAAAVQRVRWAAASVHCANNLRQIGLAVANFETTRGHLPAGVSFALPGEEKHNYLSWLARILPFIEQDGVWQQTLQAHAVGPIDFYSSSPHPFDTVIPLYGCPLDSRVSRTGMAREKFPVALTSYLGVTGSRTLRRNGVLFLNSKVRVADITDGTSNTLLAGERPPSGDLWEGWWYAGHGCDGAGRADMILGVRDGSGGCTQWLTECPQKPAGFVPGSFDNCDSLHFWSLHSGGAHFLFCDGSVRFLRYSADPIMPALATRAGNESVGSIY